MDDKLTMMFKAHANINEKRAELSKAFKAKDAELKKSLDLIEVAFLKMMNETGSDQLKVKGVGVCTRSQRVWPNCKDWRALYEHVLENGNFDLLQKRLSSTAVKEYMESHDGDTPPGVITTIERGVSVRRQ